VVLYARRRRLAPIFTILKWRRYTRNVRTPSTHCTAHAFLNISETLVRHESSMCARSLMLLYIRVEFRHGPRLPGIDRYLYMYTRVASLPTRPRMYVCINYVYIHIVSAAPSSGPSVDVCIYIYIFILIHANPTCEGRCFKRNCIWWYASSSAMGRGRSCGFRPPSHICSNKTIVFYCAAPKTVLKKSKSNNTRRVCAVYIYTFNYVRLYFCIPFV